MKKKYNKIDLFRPYFLAMNANNYLQELHRKPFYMVNAGYYIAYYVIIVDKRFCSSSSVDEFFLFLDKLTPDVFLDKLMHNT